MKLEETNHMRGTTRARASVRNIPSVRQALIATVGGVLAAVLTSGVASAHEGDYYPDETIPEKARVIIEDSTNGNSTTLIYVGIGGLVAAGAAVYLLNMAKNRRSVEVRTGDTNDEVLTGNEVSSGDSSD